MSDELRSIHEIDSSITYHQQLLTTSSRSDPLRLLSLFQLGLLRLQRHELLNQSEDFDKSIFHLTEAILLQPQLWMKLGPLMLGALPALAGALVKRWKVSGQHDDAIYAAKYFRYVRDHPHMAFMLPRHRVTAHLVESLAYVAHGTSDVVQCVEEMAALCHELLTSNAPDDNTTPSVTLLANIVLAKVKPWVPGQLWNPVIECLRLARKRKLDLGRERYALVWSLFCRYCATRMDADYDEAASAMDEWITSNSTEGSQGELVDSAQQLVTLLAMIRSKTHGNPEYSEEAIYRICTFPGPSSDKDRFSEMAAQQRFSCFGSIEGHEALSGNSPLPQPEPVSSFGVSDPETGAVDEKLKLLGGLLSGIRNDDITEIDEVIERGRTILASAPRNVFTPLLLSTFGGVLFEAFRRTKKIEYLDETINTHRQVYEDSFRPTSRFMVIFRLSASMVIRIALTSSPNLRTQYLDEFVKLFSQCVNDGQVSLPNRFRLACGWATITRGFEPVHSSVSKAYESVMSLMQDILAFAPTLQLQHATLAESPGAHRMPMDYASYRLDLHQLEEAIETLERGRALLWSEMRHLRASIDPLLQADPQLGHDFAAVNRDLEELTKSIPPSLKVSIDDGTADDLRAADPFGRLLLKQRRLLKERDKLISQIRTLPGFDGFLTSPSFNTLRSAASSGPVIIINHSQWRSDILILLHNTSPSFIQTPQDFYDRANALKNQLLVSRRKYGLDSSHYCEALASVLAKLYELIGKPVIDRFRQLQVPEQSRVWWCPTSVFFSLPLHAMGPIPSEDGEIRYFLDLYICSYTPTLSALIQSRNRDSGPRSLDRPSLLLVAQPDPSLPTVGGEIQVVQALDTEVTTLISEAATPAAVIDGFYHHRFIHFACHGTLVAGMPFDAGFELYGDKRLTLLEIVRSHLPTAEFAFLSACHTAETTERSVADEGLHLAAAVQYSGFRSVVGTMWAMVDEDGRYLAEHFYKTLFSNSRREEGIPYHERSAKALRFAVKKLRRKRRISLERWVNFVHYGA